MFNGYISADGRCPRQTENNATASRQMILGFSRRNAGKRAVSIRAQARSASKYLKITESIQFTHLIKRSFFAPNGRMLLPIRALLSSSGPTWHKCHYRLNESALSLDGEQSVKGTLKCSAFFPSCLKNFVGTIVTSPHQASSVIF